MLIPLIRLSLPSSHCRSHWLYQGLVTLCFTLCAMFWAGVVLVLPLLRVGGA